MRSGPQPSNRRLAVRAAIITAVVIVLVAAAAGVFSPDPSERERAVPTSSTDVPVDDQATTTITVAPDPAVAADVDDLKAFVAEARGLEFQHDVPVVLAAEAEFAALVDEHFAVEAADVAATAAYYEALGLIPEGSAATFVLELRERYRSILGFYDHDSELLVVRGGELDGGVRAVIVHELVHALDDQWFELSRPEYADDNTAELVQSFPMVTEGDAERIEDRWIDAQPAAVQEEARGHVGDEHSGPLSDFADFLDYGLLAPYQAGAVFVRGLAASGGERLVDAVLIDPPETTEQVLYPEVFERREGRIRVPRPPADGQIVDEGVVGVLFWTGLLRFDASGVPAETADAALRGWGGDWAVSWGDGELMCTRTDLVGDSDADTAEYLAALTQWAVSRPRVSVTEADGRVRMEVCYPVSSVGDVIR